jgi:hypothetical protein
MQIHININYFKNPQHHTQSYQLAKKKATSNHTTPRVGDNPPPLAWPKSTNRTTLQAAPT